MLAMSWSLTRAPGRGRPRRRSRFLHGLVPDAHPASRIAGERRPGAPRPRCRVCGTPLFGSAATKLLRCADCPSDVDLELLDRLKRWRAGAAKEQDVPAYVVLTDATLTAIADEAHKNGQRVLTHTVTVERGKLAAQAGIDVIAHSIRMASSLTRRWPRSGRPAHSTRPRSRSIS